MRYLRIMVGERLLSVWGDGIIGMGIEWMIVCVGWWRNMWDFQKIFLKNFKNFYPCRILPHYIYFVCKKKSKYVNSAIIIKQATNKKRKVDNYVVRTRFS